jgi:hypothetical protein
MVLNVKFVSPRSSSFITERKSKLSSVAKGPKFRPQNTKGAEKNCVGPGKSATEFMADLSKKGRKGADLFCCFVLH